MLLNVLLGPSLSQFEEFDIINGTFVAEISFKTLEMFEPFKTFKRC